MDENVRDLLIIVRPVYLTNLVRQTSFGQVSAGFDVVDDQVWGRYKQLRRLFWYHWGLVAIPGRLDWESPGIGNLRRDRR
jgi:hypothetical protein